MKRDSFPEARPFRADRLPKPPALAAFLEEWSGRNPEAVDLEIGCGVGFHPIRYARENPSRTLIAVEKTREKFAKFHERLTRTRKKTGELSNLVAVHADAVSFSAHALRKESLDRIFFFYPNPAAQNPSERWFRMPFFGHLLQKLKTGGTIHLRTNRENYLAEAKLFAERMWKLECISERRFTRAEIAPEAAETHFERKYLAREETCFELILRKAEVSVFDDSQREGIVSSHDAERRC